MNVANVPILTHTAKTVNPCLFSYVRCQKTRKEANFLTWFKFSEIRLYVLAVWRSDYRISPSLVQQLIASAALSYSGVLNFNSDLATGAFSRRSTSWLIVNECQYSRMLAAVWYKRQWFGSARPAGCMLLMTIRCGGDCRLPAVHGDAKMRCAYKVVEWW